MIYKETNMLIQNQLYSFVFTDLRMLAHAGKYK